MTVLDLDKINSHLENLSPEEIIEWAIENFPEGLYQSTAFGLTGLVTIDIISKIKDQPTLDLIFVDTLYHFPQTLDLVRNVQEKYGVNVISYKPKNTENEEDFVRQYGENLWETDETKYDYLVKVEPIQRAFKELNVKAVLTGRRRSQGGARGKLPVIEFEEESNTYKINPLCKLSFDDVKLYVDQNKVVYNELLDLGYKSVGDWHSTVPVGEGEDERSGRWKGQVKSECGIHQLEKFRHLLQQEA